MKKSSDILKIKGSSYSFQAIRVVLKTTNLFDIQAALKEYIGKDFDMFDYDDVVLDFSQVPDEELAIFQNKNHQKWSEWITAFRSYKLNLIACSGFKDFKNISQNLVENNADNNANNANNTNQQSENNESNQSNQSNQNNENTENNITENNETTNKNINKNSYFYRSIDDLILDLKRNHLTYFKTNKIEPHSVKNKAQNNNEVIAEVAPEVAEVAEVNNNEKNANDKANNAAVINDVGIAPSRYITNDIRGGTEIVENGNIIIVGNVNSGAQVVSFSDIFVFGELRGKIFAGGSDNIGARIITSNFNPDLIAIAGVFKTFENGIPEEYLNKSVCVSLEEDEENDISRLKIEVIKL